MEMSTQRTNEMQDYLHEMTQRLSSMHSSMVQVMGNLEALSEEVSQQDGRSELSSSQIIRDSLLALRVLNEQAREGTSLVSMVDVSLCAEIKELERCKHTRPLTPVFSVRERW